LRRCCTKKLSVPLGFRMHFFVGRTMLDGGVVLVGRFAVAFDGDINLAFLRLLRIARLVRTFGVLRHVRELYLLILGIMSSIKAFFSVPS